MVEVLCSCISDTTVVPTKSDSDVYFVNNYLVHTIVYTSLELTRIERSLLY